MNLHEPLAFISGRKQIKLVGIFVDVQALTSNVRDCPGSTITDERLPGFLAATSQPAGRLLATVTENRRCKVVRRQIGDVRTINSRRPIISCTPTEPHVPKNLC